MNSRIIFLLFVLTNTNVYCQTTNEKSLDMKNNLVNVSTFVSTFSNYSMDIQAAGLASIPKATLSEKGVLYIEYAYHSGEENRNGKMTLYDKGNHRFEGNWKTDADNGNSYQGTLYFVFDKLGNGDGHYKFGGSDYKISILKR